MALQHGGWGTWSVGNARGHPPPARRFHLMDQEKQVLEHRLGHLSASVVCPIMVVGTSCEQSGPYLPWAQGSGEGAHRPDGLESPEPHTDTCGVGSPGAWGVSGKQSHVLGRPWRQ